MIKKHKLKDGSLRLASLYTYLIGTNIKYSEVYKLKTDSDTLIYIAYLNNEEKGQKLIFAYSLEEIEQQLGDKLMVNLVRGGSAAITIGGDNSPLQIS